MESSTPQSVVRKDGSVWYLRDYQQHPYLIQAYYNHSSGEWVNTRTVADEISRNESRATGYVHA